jgi:hypothetical protein
MQSAIALGDSLKAHELLDFMESEPPGRRAPFLVAQAHRFRAQLDEDERGYEEAARIFGERELPFWLAVVLLEQGEATGDESALAEAREIFERLQATPWLERLEHAPEAVPAT